MKSSLGGPRASLNIRRKRAVPYKYGAAPKVRHFPSPLPNDLEAARTAWRSLPLVCLSHLRWDFVFQRPQHLLSRFARTRPVYFVEEPLRSEGGSNHLKVERRGENITVMTPVIRDSVLQSERPILIQSWIEEALISRTGRRVILWYYTPMALSFSRTWDSWLVVYDCMDELSAFAGAPATLKAYEKQLFAKADIVFTGGHTLYEAKKHQHSNVHAMPSSIDREHFAKALVANGEPDDQKAISGTKIGYFGVIDERLDCSLIATAASLKPEWQFILIGPVVKIDPAKLPRAANIHYLGQKAYGDLPKYLANWDVAMLPFELNAATRFISPTKTPEYLAGGRPVVSTAIRDVITPYADLGLVNIATSAGDFVYKAELAMRQKEDEAWRQSVDKFLNKGSWQLTWEKMNGLMEQTLMRKVIEAGQELDEAEEDDKENLAAFDQI